MKRRTGFSSTRDWMRSWVEEDTTSSESDILSGVVKDDLVMSVVGCFVDTAAAAAAGEKAVVHDADDRRAVAKIIGRIMVG